MTSAALLPCIQIFCRSAEIDLLAPNFLVSLRYLRAYFYFRAGLF